MKHLNKSICSALMTGALAVTGSAVAQERDSLQGGLQGGDRPGQHMQANDSQQSPSAYERARMQDRSTVSEDSKQEIAGTLTDVLQGAMGGDVESIVDTFAEADRERIGDQREDDYAAFNARTSSLRDAWQQKYQQSFEDGLATAAIPFQVERGVESKQARISIPAAGGAQAVQLQFIDEGVLKTTWRVDVSNSLTADQLRQRLSSAVAQIDPSALPSDAKTAYHVAALQLLAPLSSASAVGIEGRSGNQDLSTMEQDLEVEERSVQPAIR
ncbi:MAG: hypothetical protein KDD69_00980 [Bdellovibrionales bacterium]|nr:hypothetical protein [Bdellovibrionales bacterium]